MGNSVVLGFLGLAGLLLGMGAAMAGAARLSARLLGVSPWSWFDVAAPKGTWWQRLVVRLACSGAPLLLSYLLFVAGLLFGGAPVLTGHLTVLPDRPAARAGMQDGDRVVQVAETPIKDFEQLRQVLQQQHGPTTLRVVRGSRSLELTVTPEQGRIGVAQGSEQQPLSFSDAFVRAAPLPFATLRASLAGIARALSPTERPELSGPVGIARSVAGTASPSLLLLLGQLAAYLWLFAAPLPFFDAATGAAFRNTYPEAATSPVRVYRLERLRQALLLALCGFITQLCGVALVRAGVAPGIVLALLGYPTALATYPLIFIVGTELWGHRKGWLVFAASVLVPCLPALAGWLLLSRLKQELANAGMRVGFLRIELTPPRGS